MLILRGQALATAILCTLLVSQTTAGQAVEAIENHKVPEHSTRAGAAPSDTAIPNGDAGTETAVIGVPTALFDAYGVGWASFRDGTSAQFSDHFNQMKDDFLMLDIEIDVIDGVERLGAVWQTNFDNRGWAELRNLTSTEFGEQWTFYRDLGYRLIDQETYVKNNTRYYAGIWVENKENLGWASYRNTTSQQFADNFATYRDLGYVMIDIEAYPWNNGTELRYAAAWVENDENLGWLEFRDMSSAEFSDKFNLYRNTHRIWDVESYRFNGQQRYAAIWIENNGNGWAELRDMTASDYRNRWYRFRDLGYRLTDYEKYETGNGTRYAGVWRQNNDREDWELKDDVNQLVEAEFNTYDIPGIGVGVSVFGDTKYLRGHGFSDIGDNVWYSSRTVNRLASISKAIGGVLAMRMVEKGHIALDARTRDYEPSLPRVHTHTIRQLLSNRGGIGHYNEHGSVNQQFATALDGVQFFLSDPLPYNPGSGCLYSTHGSTLAAVAYEAVLGKSISQILIDELSDPYGLPTLRAEDRSTATTDWAALYNTDNTEANADFLDWKTLGGGTVAHPLDLLNFGKKLLAGQIITAANLDTLWSVPAPNCSNYALGWNVGTDRGTMVAAKDGAQLGARTYIRVYPEIEAVIVVLTNRQGGNHSANQLGRDIGTLLLNNYLGVGTEVTATPKSFSLEPPYPNPFSTSTAITYSVSQAGSARVEVYDLLGRRVAEPTARFDAAGRHEVTWDGRDQSNTNVSSGLYLIKVSTASGSATTKVVLTR